MAALDQTHANNIINASLGTQAFVATTTLQCRLMATVGSASTAGTAVSGGTYSHQPVTFGNASAGSAASNATLNFTGMPAITVNGIELWDSSGTPSRKWFGNLTTPKTTNAGDTFQIASGAITAALA